MSSLFPGALDDSSSLPNPAAGNNTNSPSHAGLHDAENAAIIAAETKLGTGSSVPASNTLLFGTGAGASAWTQLTSAQLAGVLSDETGSGAAVFGTTPTLVTPKIDTINESTPNNGTTIGGVNIKSGALNTNNSVVTANITNAAVTANKLATGAASATVATSETRTSSTFGDLATAGPSVTVTIGANGLALVAISCNYLNSTTDYSIVGLVVSGANTMAVTQYLAEQGTSQQQNGTCFLMTGLNPGSTTFKLQYKNFNNVSTATFINRTIAVVPL